LDVLDAVAHGAACSEAGLYAQDRIKWRSVEPLRIMYEQHFNFSELPFSIAPNPRYVYLSPQHREALAHLLYGISMGGGFVLLTGEVGTGKTTLCRCLLEQLPEDVDIALIFNPRLNPRELVASICDELRIPHPQHRASLKLLIDLLNHYLLDAHARGRRTVVLIDEAQNLNYDVLEQIRLLTNLETDDTKLLQIILVGQPELNGLLRRQNLRQLSQRISARYHLRPLSYVETAAYIRHRLAVSGGHRRLFTPMAEAKVYRLSGGIPRVINLICDRALLGAYTLGRTEVNYWVVRKAAREVLPVARAGRFANPLTGTLAAFALTLLAGFLYVGFAPDLDLGFLPGKLAAALERVKMTAVRNPDGQEASRLDHPTRNEPDAGSDDPVTPAPRPAEPSAVQQNTGSDASSEGSEPSGIPKTLPTAQNQPTSAAAPEQGAKPAPLAEPKPAFATLAADPSLTRQAAFDSLFSLWHVSQPPGAGDECALAKQGGLRCLFQKGSWFQLRSLDHPAVLELVLSDGSRRYATLAEVRDNRVVLFLGDQPHEFELADILPFWRGDAIVLWKPPDGHAVPIRLGDKGEAVKWLRQQLGLAVEPTQGGDFDETLQARVIAFQVEHGLIPDGVAGPQTLIYLNKKIEDPAVPRLAPEPD
jgi:general secretion pathway protein A